MRQTSQPLDRAPALSSVAAHNRRLINRFAARQYCALACDCPSVDNCRGNSLGWPKKAVTGFAATLCKN
jgi:hypothetical protein